MKEIKVVAGVMTSDNKYYIFQRDKKKSFGGYWEFPGGKIEVGESPNEALKRELKEELKIDTNIGKLISTIRTEVSENVAITISFFDVKITTGSFVLTEHEAFKLIGKSEFESVDFAPADIPILKML